MTGGRAQAGMQVMRSSCKYGWNFTGQPTAHLLLYRLVPDRPWAKNRPWPGDWGTLPYGNAGAWSRLPPSCRPGNFRLNYLKFYSWERLKLLLADIKSWLGLAQVTPFGAACFLLTSIMKEQRRKWHEGAVAFILLSLQRYGSSSSHLSPQV